MQAPEARLERWHGNPLAFMGIAAGVLTLT